jgi:succinyl-diaminopimelate desuccinylase
MTRDVIKTTCDLVSRPSVTPNDEGCQDYMKAILAPIGFNIEAMIFNDTTNMWARKGSQKPVFCFAGHTDVVPTGPEGRWTFPPFEPTIQDGFIYGRGTADMKGSLAAMLCATERFVADYPNHTGSIAYLITSDEEGPFINGTTRVIDTLEARKEKIDYCIVGEPSSTLNTGDTIKNGRRGSLTGDLVVKGIQGHVAYPHLVLNPIHAIAPAIAELSSKVWDNGNAYFPPTSFQVSNIHSGTGAGNVVPGTLELCFNFRFSTEVTDQELIEQVTNILTKHKVDYDIHWTFNGQPFITETGLLIDAVVNSIKQVTGIETQLSTAGGTSDGRFIAPTGAQVVELGPENATIHKLDEKVNIANLQSLELIYYQTLVNILT